MTFSEWLNAKSNASCLETCELVLERFRAAGDADPEFVTKVANALWGILSTGPGEDPQAFFSELRVRAGALGRERLNELSFRLLQATASTGEIEREAGKLVSSWFRAVGLCAGLQSTNRRALHVAGAYERTFASLGRITSPVRNQDQRAAA
jgi:hypothetical protein